MVVILDKPFQINENTKSNQGESHKTYSSYKNFQLKCPVIDSKSENLKQINSPGSQADSGIYNSYEKLINNCMNSNVHLTKTKSQSFPQLNKLFCEANQSENDSPNFITNCHSLASSSLDGQFIDDEISDCAPHFMQNHVSFTELINNNKSMTFHNLKMHDVKESSESEFKSQVSAEKCLIFGSGAYYGQVGIKNHFFVCEQVKLII